MVSKSTQIKLLSNYLINCGKKSMLANRCLRIFLLKPLMGVLRSATGSSSSGPVKRNKNPFFKLWFIFAFIDIWIAYIFKIRPIIVNNNFVIADRFYTDIWANLFYYGYCPAWAFKVFVKLLPKSDIPLMMSAEPKLFLNANRNFLQIIIMNSKKYINIYLS